MLVLLVMLVPLLTAAQSDGVDRAETLYPHACSQRAAAATGRFTVLPIDPFAVGENQARRHASHPRRPGTHFVTNGTAVLRTIDGGCNWTEVWRLPAQAGLTEPYSQATARIVDVVLSADPGTANAVHALVIADGGVGLNDAGTAHVVASGSSGDAGSWAKIDQGLNPLARRPSDAGFCGPLGGCVLVSAPSDGDVLYLGLSPRPDAAGTFQRSRDGGRSWTSLTVPTGSDAAVDGIEHIAVDPFDPDHVLVDHGGLFESRDGGANWVELDDRTNGFRLGVDAARGEGGAYLVSVVGSERKLPTAVTSLAVRRVGASSFDGLRTAEQVAMKGQEGTAVAAGRAARDLVIVGRDTVFAYNVRGSRFVDVGIGEPIASFAPFSGAQAVLDGDEQAFTTLGTNVLVIYHGNVGDGWRLPPPPPRLPIGTFPAPTPIVERPARLSHDGARVRVEPGGTATVRHDLTLPAPPRKVDVFFLMDTSNSMEKTVDGLAVGLADIARSLLAADVDVRFGLGEFQGSGHPAQIRFARRVDISPAGPALIDQLQSIRTQGGNEPHLTALDQMATGAGIAAPSQGRDVPAGQQASWRDDEDVVRVAIMLTNEPYGRDAAPGMGGTSSGRSSGVEVNPTRGNTPDPDGPDWPTTLQHLRADRVFVVGVGIFRAMETIGLDDPGTVRDKLEANQANTQIRAALVEDLTRWAGDTGALSPPGGVDCDGDGTIDIGTGGALVCTVEEDDGEAITELTRPLVRLILALAPQVPVEVRAASATATVEVRPAGDYSRVNSAADQLLGFDVAYGCTPEQDGRLLPVRLDAFADGERKTSASVEVACGDIPPPPVAAPPAAVPAPPPPPTPPAPPPAPISAPAAAPAAANATSTSVSSATSTALSPAPGALAFDVEQELQVATVGADTTNLEQERSRSAHLASRRRQPALPAVTWVGAMALTAAAAAAHREQEQRRVQLARGAARPGVGARRR